jgi:hypothetical protein
MTAVFVSRNVDHLRSRSAIACRGSSFREPRDESAIWSESAQFGTGVDVRRKAPAVSHHVAEKAQTESLSARRDFWTSVETTSRRSRARGF